MGKRVQVKFVKDFVASRGNSISGRKGSTKIFTASKDLDDLIEQGNVEKRKEIKPKKSSKAERREKAVTGKGRETA